MVQGQWHRWTNLLLHIVRPRWVVIRRPRQQRSHTNFLNFLISGKKHGYFSFVSVYVERLRVTYLSILNCRSWWWGVELTCLAERLVCTQHRAHALSRSSSSWTDSYWLRSETNLNMSRGILESSNMFYIARIRCGTTQIPLRSILSWYTTVARIRASCLM